MQMKSSYRNVDIIAHNNVNLAAIITQAASLIPNNNHAQRYKQTYIVKRVLLFEVTLLIIYTHTSLEESSSDIIILREDIRTYIKYK